MLLNQPSPTHTSSKGKLLFPLALFLALTLLGGLRFGDAQETADGRSQTAAENTVIPAKAGIQTEDVNTVSLDPRFRGGDENTVATQLLAPDPDYIALLEKQVEIAKMNLDYYERLHKRGYITSAQLAKTELALAEAEYALKKAHKGETANEVGHRPPGGDVGDSRPDANTLYSSAEYRTLPPGGRQPTSVQSPALSVIPRNGMRPWSAYIIESPDILSVEAIHLVPKSPYKLRVFDLVFVDVIRALPDSPISSVFAVEPGGNIQLGTNYGSVNIGGMSTDEAKEAITKHLSERLVNPIVSVQLTRMGDMQQIAGNHTVGPDGCITLGSYGRVNVNGLTVDECQKTIETHLSKSLDNPQVIVDVVSSNSKSYYIVIRYAGMSDRVMEFPCLAKSTVLGAIAGIDGLSNTRGMIKHIRPRESGEPVVTSLDWEKVLFSQSGTGDNLQLLPGDRLVLEVKE